MKVKMTRQGIDPESSEFIFAGGGAKLLHNHIRNSFFRDSLIDPDYEFANAIGSLALLR